jgi:hypothetical protein
MENEKEIKREQRENDEVEARRDAMKKLGKYAAYVAPFTVMAMSAKAASSSGPRRH